MDRIATALDVDPMDMLTGASLNSVESSTRLVGLGRFGCLNHVLDTLRGACD